MASYSTKRTTSLVAVVNLLHQIIEIQTTCLC